MYIYYTAMVFEERGEDLGRLSQHELADRAGRFYERFAARVPELDRGFSEASEEGASFQQFVDLNAAFTDSLRDADNAARHYAEARHKALQREEDDAVRLYEARLEDIAREHARLAGSWNEVLEEASKQNMFLPGGALLLAKKAKDAVDQSLPQIRATITRLVGEGRTVLGLARGISEEAKRALALNLRAVQIQCDEGATLARSAAIDATEGSKAKIESERLIAEFEALTELLVKAYDDAERDRLLPGENE